MALAQPSSQWLTSFRDALVESWADGSAAPWDPSPTASDDELSAAIVDMAAGIWGPGATAPTQVIRWWVEGDTYVARSSLRLLSVREERPAFYSGHGDIGYDVRPSARGRGVATSLLCAMVDLAWELGYPDLLITCAVSNAASRRVIEKAGFQHLDTMRDEGEDIHRFRLAP